MILNYQNSNLSLVTVKLPLIELGVLPSESTTVPFQTISYKWNWKGGDS